MENYNSKQSDEFDNGLVTNIYKIILYYNCKDIFNNQTSIMTYPHLIDMGFDEELSMIAGKKIKPFFYYYNTTK